MSDSYHSCGFYRCGACGQCAIDREADRAAAFVARIGRCDSASSVATVKHTYWNGRSWSTQRVLVDGWRVL